MPSVPSKLQIGTSTDDAYALLNNNFDGIAQDLRDFGAATSTSTTVTFTSLGASTLDNKVTVLTYPGQTNASSNQMKTTKVCTGVAVASPFVTVFVDGQLPANAWQFGSLSVAQSNFQISVTPINAVYNGSLAAFNIEILNRDTSAHTYYVTMACWYIPINTSGQFR